MNIHSNSTVTIELPLAYLTDSLEDIELFAQRNFGTYQINHYETYNFLCTDMSTNWSFVNNVKNYNRKDGPFQPGVYALVFDTDNVSSNPIFDSNTILFGESTRDTYKRLEHQVGALRGTTTNMTNKWERHLPKINEIFNTDITKHLDKIKIYFRPHDEDMGKWRNDRVHSVWMETSCHAMYVLIHGQFTPGNTRDLPSSRDINRYRQFLSEQNFFEKFST